MSIQTEFFAIGNKRQLVSVDFLPPRCFRQRFQRQAKLFTFWHLAETVEISHGSLLEQLTYIM